MIINIKEKYRENIGNNFDHTNKKIYESMFSSKERNMWYFVSLMIKTNPEKEFYDSIRDRKYLSLQLELTLAHSNLDSFTLDEWFNYLNNR